MKSALLLVVAAMAIPSAAHAVAFTNGSFEDGPVPGQFVTLGAGDTSITGWTVTGGGIDYIGSYWTASNGARSLDLSAGTAGGIEQTFDTVAGRAYRVTYDLAGNPEGGAALKSLTVGATGNAADTQTFDTTGRSRPTLGFTPRTYTFTASAASTTLSFASNTTDAYGPVLDNVALSAVPEPATWAMMIGGLGLIGGSLRRRRVGTPALA